ncbi:MAG: SDR family oxidoreductase [Acidimicrobiaceae bacterium]|nr:SDR family oxidoreductase [Acidimicrobiaceae bacterium]MYC40996.1 SDR family oxidoreductase [Acidimicrobiaceae bacterium]MYH87206.1 SDR family oxidoreductase [Acidimicrobiaceae bacterium]
MSGLLEGKVSLITGAAAGIGAAVAKRFAAEGAVLWLNDLNPTALEAIVAETGGRGLAGNMSDSAFATHWVNEAAAQHGRIDVLYNNVGVSRTGLIGELSDEDWRFQQQLTLDTVFFATRAALSHMERQRSGSIVSISSGAGIGGQYRLGGYAAAKAGVISLMETVATEYGHRGIRANSLTPGPTATEPLLEYLKNQPGGVAAHTADLNLARLSEVEEIAATVSWLASDEASNVSGICLQCNIRSASRRPT